MINLIDANTQLALAFGIVLIAGLLLYIAFVKNSTHPDRTKRK